MTRLLLYAVALIATAGVVYGQLNCSIVYTTYVEQCTGCIFNPGAPFNLPYPYTNFSQTLAALEAEIALLQGWLTGNITAFNTSLVSCESSLTTCNTNLNATETELSAANTALAACDASLNACLTQGTAYTAALSGTPNAAFSLRQLSTIYTGPLVRLVRANDTVEEDFFPTTTTGVLNTTSVLAFVGLQTALVTVLYDQTGNGNHFTQSIQAAMPILAQNGAIILSNGRPAMLFNSITTTATNIPSSYGGILNSGVPLMTSLIGPQLPVVAASIVFEVFANSSNWAGIIGRFGYDDGLRYLTTGNVQLTFNNEESATNTLSVDNGVPSISSTPSVAYTTGNIAEAFWTTPISTIVNTIGGYFGNFGPRPLLGTISEIVLWDLQPNAIAQNADFGNKQVYYDIAIATPQTAAYSVRLVVSGYPGNAMIVRRSLDNTTLTIGFVGVSLDTTTLLKFTGNSTGYVTTWFDQSGNGFNAIQTNSSNQPTIVVNGTLNTQNGQPIVVFSNHANTYMLVSGGYTNTGTQLAAVAVLWFDDSVDAGTRILDIGNAGESNGVFVQQTNQLASYSLTTAFPATRLQIATSTTDGVNQHLSLDGVAVSNSPYNTAFNIHAVSIGAELGTPIGNAWNGQLAELLLYNTPPTAFESRVLTATQKLFYQIGPLPIAEQLAGLGSNYVVYSVRLAVNAYTGYCMQVYSSITATTKNIGFTTEGNLDVVSLLTFIGTGNGTISIWYDQGPLGANMVQSNITNQPVIVVNGVLLRNYNGRPAPTFYTAQHMYLQTFGFINTGASIFGMTVASVTTAAPTNARLVSASPNTNTLDSAGATGIALFAYNSTGYLIDRGSNSAAAPATANFVNTISASSTTASLQLSVNEQGVTPVTINTTAFGINVLQLGGGVSSTNTYWDGTLQELFVSSAIPTVPLQLYQSQQFYFNAYTQPLSMSLTSAPQLIGIYGLRLLVANYTGPLVDITRSSDSTVATFFVDATTGMVNTTGILAFVGTGNGGISRWYDQSGNTNDLTQATQSQMPVLVNAGLLNMQNGLACPRYNATANMTLQNTGASGSQSSIFFSAVFATTTADTNNNAIISVITSTATLSASSSGVSIMFLANAFTGDGVTTNTTATVLHTVQSYNNNNNIANSTYITVDLNAPIINNESFGWSGFNDIAVGALVGGGSAFDGYICEVWFGTQPSNSDLAVIKLNQRTWWNTP